jgi:hypothetical protein
MADCETIVRRFQDVLDRRARRRRYMPALLGENSTAGSAGVSGKPGWVYARVGGDDEAAQIINERVIARNGLAVWVAESETHPGFWEVVGERQVYEDQIPSGGALVGHHTQHEYGNASGSDDVVYPWLRQIADLRVEPTSPESLSVTVKDGLYKVGGAVDYYAGDTVDLTSYKPSFGYKWVTLSLSNSGTINVAEGQIKIDISVTDIPSAVDSDDWELAAVRLHSCTTEITDWPDDAMIVDLRFARGPSARAFLDLTDTPSSYGGQSGKVPAVNSTEDALELIAAGASVFTGLSDTPSNYTGSAGKVVRVNSTENALEFSTAGATAFVELSDTPGNYTGAAYKRVRVNSTADALEFQTETKQIVVVIGSGQDVIPTGVAGYLPVTFDGTIVEWHLAADQSGSIVIDVWNDIWANFPPTAADTIAGSEKPTLSGAQSNKDENLSSWTTGLSDGDVLGFNVDSASTVQQVTLVITAEVK